ncbi:MAG: kelch repeat-containing protein [Archangium sp.]
MKRTVGFAALAVVIAGCAPKEVNYAVNIVTQSCDAASNPFEGVQFLKVKISGDEMEVKTAVSAANTATPQIKIPEIPAGKNRVIEVRAYDAEPSGGGRVVSIGRSPSFDVPDVVPEELMGGSIKVNVILRKVNAFAPIVSAAAPTQCQGLRVNRAGHTATLLKNGKVFIAGGYNFKQGSAEKKALADTELFNPATGAFELGKPISITSQGAVYELPRAYHTATLLQSGQVMLWGGETYGGGANNQQSIISTILFYDSDVDDYGAIGPRTPAQIARSHHAAAVDANGKVLIVGGVTKLGSNGSIVPVNEVEWLDPSNNLYKIIDGVMLPRLDPVVMPVKKGEFIAVAGGSDGSNMKTDISFFKFTGNVFGQVQQATPPRIADPGRRAAAGALIRDGADLLILGGYGTVTMPSPVASSEVLNAAASTVTPGPDVRSARGELCAVTLPDGTVLAIGGRTVDGSVPRADATAVLITAAATGGVTSIGAPNLPRARYAHTCTALADGTVLVTGGINETSAGAIEILQDAYIFTPPPPPDE